MLGACREEWSRSIVFDRTLILSFEQVWCRPNTPCFAVSSTFSACTKQDAVHPGPDLCVPCSLDPQTWTIPSVFCSNFVLLVSILNSWWSVNWLHIKCDKCTRRNRSESIHCPVVKDQWGCVLNDLEEFGGKEFLVLMDQVQYWNLFLLPPPPAILFFHISSDQCWEFSKSNRRSSFSLQNSIASSSSRGRWPWRRRVLSCFDTGKATGE